MVAQGLLLAASMSQLRTVGQTNWQWDHETPVCALLQTSAAGGMIEIKRTPANDGTEIEITIPAGPKLREGHFLDAKVSTDGGHTVAGDVSTGRDKKGQLKVFLNSADATFIDDISTTTWLEISHEKIAPLRVPIRSARFAKEALHECEDRTMRQWGIDPGLWRALKVRPLPLNHILDRFSSLDYPPEALANNIEYDAITRLDVARDGTVSHCSALNSGTYRGFEQAACKVLKGSRFDPAQDANGNAVPAPIIFDVVFRIAP